MLLIGPAAEAKLVSKFSERAANELRVYHRLEMPKPFEKSGDSRFKAYNEHAKTYTLQTSCRNFSNSCQRLWRAAPLQVLRPHLVGIAPSVVFSTGAERFRHALCLPRRN